MENNKEWYQSKTIWINILSLVVLVLSTMAGWVELKDMAPQMLFAVNIINIGIRFLTSGGIK
jgi:hypothetical protein